jgi:hypothetical protein
MGTRLLVWWLLGVVALPASAFVEDEERRTFRGETVVVTPDEDFSDFEQWRSALTKALDAAPLKERSELTEHDQRQILVLRDDMPKLRRAIADMGEVIARNPSKAQLSEAEKVKLVRAYVFAQGVLADMPDELTIHCELRPLPGRRNQGAVCEFDYFRAQQFLLRVGGPKLRHNRDLKKQFLSRNH